jgi:PAT family beta-lactamase induction signal transducer AmpG
MRDASPASHPTPALWIPILYFAQGLPYTVVMAASVIMYKRLGVSNTEIALYTSLLNLPWVIKPLWSPIVDVLHTKRHWILLMQALIVAGLAAIGFLVLSESSLLWTLLLFVLLAVASATHDIAADGYYMLALSSHDQAWYVGIRSTWYRIAMVIGQGVFVVLAGYLEERLANPATAWSIAFWAMAASYGVLFMCSLAVLPRYEIEVNTGYSWNEIATAIAEVFTSFFQKPQIVRIIAFLLFYSFSGAQLARLEGPFLLDVRAMGGLELTTIQTGFLDGTLGVVLLLSGGILGGIVAARFGLKACLWWMALAINVPKAAFLWLAVAQPESLWQIGLAIAIEQLGHGFGFAGFMLYMLYVASGKHETAHYAICTGFMSLGLMLPGMWSGQLQALWGYQQFFAWVLIATIPSFFVTYLIPLAAEFGKSRRDA